MSSLNVAIIGSGLSSLGALASLERSEHHLSQYMGEENGLLSGGHKLYINDNLRNGPKLIIHKSNLGLKKIASSLESKYGLNAEDCYKVAGLLTTFASGGLSNFWGGACHPLLPDENILFKKVGLDIPASLPEIFSFAGHKGPIFDEQDYDLASSEELSWRRTIQLTNNGITPLNALSVINQKKHPKIYEVVKKLELNKNLIDVISVSSKGDEVVRSYDHVFVAAGIQSSSLLASGLLGKSLDAAFFQNDQSIFFGKYRFSSLDLKTINSTAAPSLILSINGLRFYIQLYPVKHFHPLEFYPPNQMPNEGYLFGYIYAEYDNSEVIKVQSHDDKHLNYTICGVKNSCDSSTKGKIKELLRSVGVNIWSGIIPLAAGCSQHFSSSLYVGNRYSVLGSNFGEDMGDKLGNRVHFVDSSIFPQTPLCTIGLTSAAVAYAKVDKWRHQV